MFFFGRKKYNDVVDDIWSKFCVDMYFKFFMIFENLKADKMGNMVSSLVFMVKKKIFIKLVY